MIELIVNCEKDEVTERQFSDEEEDIRLAEITEAVEQDEEREEKEQKRQAAIERLKRNPQMADIIEVLGL